jgi:putative phosphoribosyl transferase
MLFKNRSEAGKQLAQELRSLSVPKDALVLALPRGGVPVAYEVAMSLNLPLDIFLVRKLGVPGREELAMGAIASGGITVFNDGLLSDLNLEREVVDRVVERERSELIRREVEYRDNRPAPNLFQKTVIVVDDGLATGATMRAAVRAIRESRPMAIIIAVPTAAISTIDELKHDADEIVCSVTPDPFHAVGEWYETFSQVSDEEVKAILSAAHEAGSKSNAAGKASGQS